MSYQDFYILDLMDIVLVEPPNKFCIYYSGVEFGFLSLKDAFPNPYPCNCVRRAHQKYFVSNS